MDLRRAGLLVAVVATMVVVCRGCVTGDGPDDRPGAGPAGSTATAQPWDGGGHSEGDGHSHADPGAGESALTMGGSPAPTYSAPPGDDSEAGSAPPDPGARPAVATVAAQFAAHWVRHTGDDAATWLTRLEPLVSPATVEALRRTDPATVPANRVTGAPAVAYGGGELAAATVTTDAGRLELRLLRTDRWRVIAISWQRGG